jgi:hypothetical protein
VTNPVLIIETKRAFIKRKTKEWWKAQAGQGKGRTDKQVYQDFLDGVTID